MALEFVCINGLNHFYEKIESRLLDDETIKVLNYHSVKERTIAMGADGGILWSSNDTEFSDGVFFEHAPKAKTIVLGKSVVDITNAFTGLKDLRDVYFYAPDSDNQSDILDAFVKGLTGISDDIDVFIRGVKSYDYVTNLLATVKDNIDYTNPHMRSIAHRGYSTEAPENTLQAYILAKKKGFTYVETDVAFTSDGIPVLLHDSTIDRTSNGSGKVYEMTYEELLHYDFGSWKSTEYAGTKIVKFIDFLKLCKNLALHPYIELKWASVYSDDQIKALVSLVKSYGLSKNVTWLSSAANYLKIIKSVDSTATLNYLNSTVTEDTVDIAKTLETGTNTVYVSTYYRNLTDTIVDLCAQANIPLGVYTVDSKVDILNLPPYVTAVTSNVLLAEKVLYDATMSGNYSSYLISNKLENVTTNNTSTTVLNGNSYDAILTVADGYSMLSLNITMGGVDITSTACSNNVISIPSVNGDIVITATAVVSALIDIDMNNNGVNVGTGGSAYDAVNTAGTFSNGKFIINDNTGYLTVPTEFMNESATVAFTIDKCEIGTKNYSRVARGNNDIPSIYYQKSMGGFRVKLTGSATTSSTALWYDESFFSLYDETSLIFNFNFNEKTTFVFKHDGTDMSFWVNGKMVMTQKIANYYQTNFPTTFSIGDNTGASTNEMLHLECSMLKLWNTSLTDEEIVSLK